LLGAVFGLALLFFSAVIAMFGGLFGKKDKSPKAAETKAPEAKREAPQPPAKTPQQTQAVNDPLAGVKRDALGGAETIDALKSRMQTALAAKAGPKSAPPSLESAAAQAAATTSLAGANDPSAKAAARDLASGALDQAFDTLERDARAAAADAAEKWRRIGALAFGVDAGRAMRAYEEAFKLDRKDFWTGIFLARLRGLGGGMEQAMECARAARDCAQSEEQRSLAHAELAMISLGRGDGPGAIAAAGEAVASAKTWLAAHPQDHQALRDMAARFSLHGDAYITQSDAARARDAYLSALEIARKLGLEAPQDASLARLVANCLEKVSAAYARLGAHQEGVAMGEDSLAIRRKIVAQAHAGVVEHRALAGALNTLGEIKRMANDSAGAREAFRESLALSRKLAGEDVANPAAQREVWVALWRLAQMDGSGISWREVAETMDKMAANGAILDADQRFLAEAKRRAGVAQ
jgi:tetratricopeptide (TPR) repeat protein